MLWCRAALLEHLLVPVPWMSTKRCMQIATPDVAGTCLSAQVLDGKEDSLALAGSRTQAGSDQRCLHSFLAPSRPPPGASDAPGASGSGRAAAGPSHHGAVVHLREP